METFVHAEDPVKALRNFYRLRPGGVLVHNEADFSRNSTLL
jgi:sterol 24-C-methyltransferase